MAFSISLMSSGPVAPHSSCTTSLVFHELMPLATMVGNRSHHVVRPSSSTELGLTSTLTRSWIGKSAQ